MRELPIEEVEPGAELAAALMSEEGTLILNRGALLSESVLNRLRRVGVASLPVSTDPSQLEEERTALLAAIQERFAGTENNPFLQELKRVAEHRVAAENALNRS